MLNLLGVKLVVDQYVWDAVIFKKIEIITHKF